MKTYINSPQTCAYPGLDDLNGYASRYGISRPESAGGVNTITTTTDIF